MNSKSSIPKPDESAVASVEETSAQSAGEGRAHDDASLNVTGKRRDTSKLDERMMLALHAASDKKALALVMLDLREVANFTDYFLIASGANMRQVQAIADGIVEHLKKNGTRPARVEGYNAAEWILLDYGDFVCHVFEDKARKFYDLERLWRDAARVALPRELTGEASDRDVLRDDADETRNEETGQSDASLTGGDGGYLREKS